jgi:hypothetical protein
LNGRRFVVVATIALMSIGGVLTRATQTSDFVERREVDEGRLSAMGFKVVGDFREPLTGSIGYEVELPNCERRLGLILISGALTEISPTAFRYHDGDYSSSYIYRGESYNESWFSVRLGAMHALARVSDLLRGRPDNLYSAYFKTWTPAECAGLSRVQTEALDEGDDS